MSFFVFLTRSSEIGRSSNHRWPLRNRRGVWCCLVMNIHNSETFSLYMHNAPFMYSTLHVSPWKYFLIRIQWRMNLEASSCTTKLQDANIAYIFFSWNSVSVLILQGSALDETLFTFWGIDAHRNSKSLQARWKLRTNICSAPPGSFRGAL